MRRSIQTALTVVVLASAPVITWAQAPRPGVGAPPQVTPPAAPAADAPKRQEVVVPAGFQKVTVGEHTALCEAGDVAWVRQALGEVKPVPKPSPTPTEVIRGLTDKRAALAKQVATDLALPAGDRSVDEFLDGKLIPTLKKLDTTRPPVFLLVTSHAKLRDLTKTGWGEPRFHYNGVADAAVYDTSISYSLDRPMDDVVLPSLYDDKTPADAKSKGLIAVANDLDANIARSASGQVTPVAFNLFVGFLRERHLDPLKLRRDQQWLAMGVSNFLATKYASAVTGTPRENMLRELASEPEGFPVSARSIDLLRPADEASMRPQLVPFYTMSMQRKALAVVAFWVEQAGEAAIPKTLAALRRGVPADGAGLVKTVQEASGVDLSRYLGA